MIGRLSQLRDPLADRALVEALPTADRHSQRRVAQSLLERGSAAAIEGLVGQYHQLDEACQREILAAPQRLGPGVQAVIAGDATLQARLNAIELIDRSDSRRLAYLLGGQLHGGNSQLSRAASAALLRLVRRYVLGRADVGGHRPRLDPAELDMLRSVVAEACACFHQHRRRDVLLAVCCLMPRVGDAIARHVFDRRGAAHHAACELVRQADHPLAARALLGFCRTASMRPSVAAALSQRDDGQRLVHVLAIGHLLVDPQVRSTVRKARCQPWLVDAVAGADRWPAGPARRLPRWIDTVTADAGAQIDALSRLSSRNDRIARLLALRGLCGHGSDAADQIVASMCFDADATIARIALRHLIRRRWAGLGKLVVRLISSDHPDLRDLAERHLGPVGFDRLWANWPHMGRAAKLTAGRALMKVDGGFARKLDRKLQADEPAERLAAVMMVRQLQQADRFADRLLELADDGDARVASAAVKALGSLSDQARVAEALELALHHDDDRVRSNAIEALERLKRVRPVASRLFDMAGRQGRGKSNRSRATAIKALLELPTGDALPQLQQMLRDADQAHRISALWVVERLGLLPLVQAVAELARHDPDAKVRRRAIRVVRDIAEVHRAGASGRGAGASADRPLHNAGHSGDAA